MDRLQPISVQPPIPPSLKNPIYKINYYVNNVIQRTFELSIILNEDQTEPTIYDITQALRKERCNALDFNRNDQVVLNKHEPMESKEDESLKKQVNEMKLLQNLKLEKINNNEYNLYYDDEEKKGYHMAGGNNSYYHKYMKYKNKYLELKNKNR